jgi:hypothetical protein
MAESSKQIYNYTILLEKEADGGYHAFCPILKGCHSQGDTFEEAVQNVKVHSPPVWATWFKRLEVAA